MSDTATNCTKCGTELSGAKRFKDSKGRAFCEPCAAALKAKAAAKLGGVPAESHAPPPPVPALPDDGTIALADEPPVAAPKPRGPTGPGGLQVCPDCGHPMGSASDICKACGYNRATGQHIGKANAVEDGEKRGKHKPRPCKKCGYDMTGTKTGRCPECGTLSVRMSSGRETEQQTLRKMFVAPLIMIGVGVGIAATVRFFIGLGGSGSGLAGGIESVLAYLVIYAVLAVIGFAAYVGCSIAFIGFDEPLGVTFVRLAGVYAVIDAMGAVMGFLPWWIGWPIQMFVYVGLLMQIMELDLEDAWVVAVVTYIVHAAAFVGLVVLWTMYF